MERELEFSVDDLNSGESFTEIVKIYIIKKI